MTVVSRNTELSARRAGRSRQPYRAVWISDVHLGSRGCNAERLLDFLAEMETDTLYLVGDIVDFWALRSRFFWPESHRAVVRAILEHARQGTSVLYIPGNHDDVLRKRIGSRFGSVEVVADALHETEDGRQLLVVHGDMFDIVSRNANWMWHLGARAYTALLVANRQLNRARRRFGLPYWSLSAFVKSRVKRAVNLIGNYETALVGEARRRQVHGIVCGHIHHAEVRNIGTTLYGNSGDWVESCTALVEHHGGKLEVLQRALLGDASEVSPRPASKVTARKARTGAGTKVRDGIGKRSQTWQCKGHSA